ncbi:hypothetical protein FACS189487_00620 [Campylobacterota bacterium]|nr:hypothetical protein FACS189487_00620 [Campylobacterota bacterium]
MVRFWLILALALPIFADRYYFTMPKEGDRAEAQLVREFGKAKTEIKAAIYSFTNGTITKALKDAAARGVKVYIVVDEKNLRGNMEHSKAGELAKLQNIKVRIAKGNKAKNGDYYGIMHHKIASIDRKVSIYGSANWTASAFNINHELLFIDDDPKMAQEIDTIVMEIFDRSADYINGKK